MNPALYWFPRRTASPEVERVAESASPDASGGRMLVEASPTRRAGKAAGSGKIVGFWLIPDESGYLKLKIADSYQVDGRRVEGFSPDRPWPVWPVLANRDLLGRHLRWLSRLTGDDAEDQPDLYDPGARDHDSRAEQLVHSLFYHRWKYLVVEGETAYFGSMGGGGNTLKALLEEVIGGEVHRPASVSVDFSGVKSLIVVDSEGTHVRTIDRPGMEAILDMEGDDPDQRGRDDMEHRLARALKDDPAAALKALLKLYPEHSLDFRILQTALSPEFLTKHLGRAVPMLDRDGVAHIRAVLNAYFQECRRRNADVPALDQYPKELGLDPSRPTNRFESLEEASYLDLWNLTRRNGDYVHGGMRRIRGRWVYDTTVRGRSQNGARYVVTTPPTPYLDDDGLVTLRFRYQSRPARNTTGMSHVGYIKYPNHAAFMKTASRNIGMALAKRDVQVYCNCFAAGALVLMRDGRYLPIEQVQVGDEVITHRGRPRKVTRTVHRQMRDDENAYEVATAGFPDPVVTTGDHPYLTLRGNDRCLCGCGRTLAFGVGNTLSPECMLKRKCIQGHGGRQMTQEDRSSGWFAWTPVAEFRKQEWFLMPWIEPGKTSMAPELARLLGYYAAEGSIADRGRQVKFTLNRNEMDTVAEDIARMCRRLGYPVRKRISNLKGEEASWMTVTVTSSEFRDFCLRHVGRGSWTKRFSPAVMDWDRSAMTEVLVGLFLGDGSVSGAGSESRAAYFSANRDLASQAYSMLCALGLRGSLAYHNKNIRSKSCFSQRDQKPITLTRSLTYQVSLAAEARNVLLPLMVEVTGKAYRPSPRVKSCKFVPEEGQLRSLKKITPSDFRGRVYDLTVEEDESFIVNGVAVHNCQDFQYRWHWVLAREGAAPQPVGLGNAPPRRTNPQMRVSMCKHLSAISSLLLMRPTAAYDREVRRVLKQARAAAVRPSEEPGKAPTVEPGASVTPVGSPPSTAPEEPEIEAG